MLKIKQELMTQEGRLKYIDDLADQLEKATKERGGNPPTTDDEAFTQYMCIAEVGFYSAMSGDTVGAKRAAHTVTQMLKDETMHAIQRNPELVKKILEQMDPSIQKAYADLVVKLKESQAAKAKQPENEF